MRKLCKVILRKEITDEAGSYKQEKENNYNAYSSFVCDSGCIFCCLCYKEANHKCNHTDCQICQTMQLCIKNLTDLGSKSDDM